MLFEIHFSTDTAILLSYTIETFSVTFSVQRAIQQERLSDFVEKLSLVFCGIRYSSINIDFKK